MADIDEERLQILMELVNKENPDLDPYVIWVICVNHLLNEHGIYGDEEVAKQLREQRNHELKYDIKVI
jgi:hypothetical protein